ncbi:MAG: C39 family peptidase [Candidatus Paceibacterota bacterium]|jgi:uncharacterized protein YvpB
MSIREILQLGLFIVFLAFSPIIFKPSQPKENINSFEKTAIYDNPPSTSMVSDTTLVAVEQNLNNFVEPELIAKTDTKTESPKVPKPVVYSPKLLVDISFDTVLGQSKGVRVIFNMNVDKKSAEKAFSITPFVSGDFSWNGKVMTWLPSSLEKGVSYTVSVSRGVLPQSGTSNDKVSTRTFIAQASIKRLAVPYFKQTYARSCEESALRMALAYYGIQETDFSILEKVGYSPRAWNRSENIWDDPDEQFVGFVDGARSGYGAFRAPIARAAQSFGRSAESYTNISAQFLAENISEGYPVVVWGYNASLPVKILKWQTDSGKEITAYQGEHTRTVVGMVGEKENPIGFYVHDPQAKLGSNEYWRADKLIDHMNIFGELSNQAVVVR